MVNNPNSIFQMLGCVILGKWLHLSGPQFYHLQNERAEIICKGTTSSNIL